MSRYDHQNIDKMKRERVDRFEKIRESIKRHPIAVRGNFRSEELIGRLTCARGTARQVIDDMVQDSELIRRVTAKGHSVYSLAGGANYWLQRKWTP